MSIMGMGWKYKKDGNIGTVWIIIPRDSGKAFLHRETSGRLRVVGWVYTWIMGSWYNA
jgi:hypothetical protein